MHIHVGGYSPQNPFTHNRSLAPGGQQYHSPLGQRNRRGGLLGGIVGGVLGTLLSPIPILGTAIGAVLGSSFGSAQDHARNPGSSSCCHNMQRSYGGANSSMAMGYGNQADFQALPDWFQFNHPKCQMYPKKKLAYDQIGYPLQSGRPQISHPVQSCGSNHSRNQYVVGLIGGRQRIETSGSNSGNQLQLTPVIGRDQTIHTGGSNSGNQVQIAPLLAGDQEIVTGGSNSGNQLQVTPLIAADQSIATGRHNEGNQRQFAVVGAEQTIATRGDNEGDQTRARLFGGSPQSIYAQGGNSGAQTDVSVFGDVEQYSHSQGANTGSQRGTSVIGEGYQEGSGGANSQFTQELAAEDGRQVFAAGANSQVEQRLVAEEGGEQTLYLESGEGSQEGAATQTAIAAGGPVDITQTQGPDGNGHLTVRGSGHGDSAEQTLSQDGWIAAFDDNGSADISLGDGDDDYEGLGNGGDNHFRIDGRGSGVGSDRDFVQLETQGGNDTVVLNTSRERDLYEVDMGTGRDHLIIDEAQGPVRVLGEDGETIYQSRNWTSEHGTVESTGMERMSVYRPDGSFTRWSEEGGSVEGRDAGRPGEMTPVAAARILREHAGLLDQAAGVDGADGVIGGGDLTAALSDPRSTPELRAAIQYARGNDAMWRALDTRGAGDNRTNMEALNGFIDSYETRQPPTEGPMTDRRAVEILNYHSGLIDSAASGADGRFREADLQAIISGDNAGLPHDLRAAAHRFLGSETLQRDVDRASAETSNPLLGQLFTERDLARY